VKQHANGVNVLHLKPDHIGDYEFYIAPEKLQKQFSDIASTIFKMCDFLELKTSISAAPAISFSPGSSPVSWTFPN